MNKHADKAVIVALSGNPKSGIGGPHGAANLLLKGLSDVEISDCTVYFANTVSQKLVAGSDAIHGKEGAGQSTDGQSYIRSFGRRYLPWLFDLAKEVKKVVEIIKVKRSQEWLTRQVAVALETYSEVSLHCHEVISCEVAVKVAAEFENCDVVYTEHHQGGMDRTASIHFGQRLYFLMLRRAYSYICGRIDEHVFPSRGAVDLFYNWSRRSGKWKKTRNNATVVHNGIEPIQISRQDVDDDSFSIIVIAQHFADKGLDRVIKALWFFNKQSNQEWDAEFLGTFSALTSRYKKLVTKAELGDFVTLCGRVPHDMCMEKLAKCDVYLGLPRATVFDLSLLEAMSLGVPIITSNLGGNREALGKNYPGLCESPEEAATLLLRLVRDEEFGLRLGKLNSRRFQENFTVEAMGERYVRLYNKA